MTNPKAPKAVRAHLRKLIALCERGPSLSDDRGRDIPDPGKLWRDTWVTPELRALLAWADGALSLSDSLGEFRGYRAYDYGKDSK